MFCRKRHVVNNVLNTFTLPTDEQKIVKLIRSWGNNLHEVVTPEGEKFLASMPTKFRNYLWVGRGCFVVVDPIEEGGRVKGEIIQLLLKEQIQHLMDEDAWPDSKEFSVPFVEKSKTDSDSNKLFVNTNSPYVDYPSSEEGSSEEESEDEDDSS
ncbi:probable RNA-binding protein EIF1AD [Trichonephila clavipes]|nr:probable RNA-binding protein EIF1AD [Trichonephila clavipes]